MEKHSEILPQLAAFHDGQLSTQERLVIESHLQVCPSCRRKLEDWQALDQAILTLPVPEPSDDVYRRTVAAISKETPPTPVRVYFRPQVRWLAVAAVLMFVAVTAVMWRQESSRTVVQADKAQIEPQSPAVAKTEPLEVALPQALESQADASYASRPELPKANMSAAPQPVGTGDSGIPQPSDWRARLFDAELRALASLHTDDRLRWSVRTPPQRIVEINLLPLFEVGFVPVGYKPLEPALNPGHEAAYSDPVLLTPETAYLVSNLRLEQTSLWARSHEEGASAEVTLKLAEITWQLAHITADRDDVKSAIAALSLAARQKPDMAADAELRISQLRAQYGE